MMVEPCQLFADDVTLVEQHTIRPIELVDADQHAVLRDRHPAERITDLRQDP
jgi:hypothetical protein